MSNLQAANAALAKGYSIFPCVPNEKRPATWRGFLDATRDPKQIEHWFGFGYKNIGVATGDASGVVVIDIDGYKPGVVSAFKHLEEVLGELPRTYSVTTRAGGLHLYFKMPKGADLRSYNGQLAEGIDLRANGGYVLGVGSYVAEDKNGKAGYYTENCDMEPVELPEAWVKAWTALNIRQDELLAKKKLAAERKAQREAAKSAAA